MEIKEAKYHFKYKGEEIKAFCYLYKDKDEANKCLLTDQQLIILLKKIEYSFPLNQVHSIQLENRYSMFPLIVGGIVLPFSLIAIFNNLYDPWVSIYVMLIAALSFYKGWLGHPVISIIFKGSINETIHLRFISESLRTFIRFTNEVIKMGIKDALKAPYIYHIVDKKNWEYQKRFKLYAPPSLKSEGFIHCSQKEQLVSTINRFFRGQKDLLILYIDPLKVKAEIRYEPAKDSNELFPHIYGQLNTDAVIKEELWKE